MLSGLPVHGSSERQSDGVFGNELDGAMGVLVLDATPYGVVNKDPNNAHESVKGPDHKRGPDVGVVAWILGVIVARHEEDAALIVSAVLDA
jgi:hypothetical protein